MTKAIGVSIVAVPRPFLGHTEIIQRNALASWTRLAIADEIILLGRDDGVRVAAELAGAIWSGDITYDERGTPLVDDIIRGAARLARTDWLCYVNADIILMPEFSEAVRLAIATLRSCLIVSRRWNLDVHERLEFNAEWQTDLRRRAADAAMLFTTYGIDVFVFPKHMFPSIPPFALGRSAWDNWLVAEARRLGAPVVDVTAPYTVIHQNHSYGELGSMENIRRSQQGLRNFWLAGDSHFLLGRVDDATHRFVDGAIVEGTKSVSIVVAYSGTPGQLRGCLGALSAQTYPRTHLELIVVDGAHDGSASAVALEFPYVRITREHKPGPAAMRNKGAAIANGDLLAFVDSECRPAADWVERAVTATATCGFRAIVASNIKPLFARGGSAGVQHYDWIRRREQAASSITVPSCAAAAMIVPRPVWVDAGAFDERLPACCEEWEWSTRAVARGISIVHATDAVVGQPLLGSWRELREQARRTARGELLLAELRSDRRLLEPSSLRSACTSRLLRELYALFSDGRPSVWTRLVAATAAFRMFRWILREMQWHVAAARRRTLRRAATSTGAAEETWAVRVSAMTRADSRIRR